MENQLETNIYSMNDSDFESLISGAAPVTEVVENQQQAEEKPEPVTQPVAENNTSIIPLEDNFFEDLETVVDDKQEGETEKVKEPVKSESNLETSVLQNIAEYFIEEGVWDDFEERETFDFSDNKAVADLLVKQTEKKAYDYLGELVENTGPYGKAIINYVQNGGNPDDLIDIFKEEKEVKSADITTDEGKRAFIQDYYVNVANMKPERAKKVVEALELEGEIDNELNDVKGQYDQYYKVKTEQLSAKAELEAEQKQEQQTIFRNSIINEVTKRNDLTEKQRRQLAEAILVEDQELNDGSRTTKFYAALSQVQNNVSDYLEVVEFITDREGFKKRLMNDTKNKDRIQTFNFLKQNNATKKTGSSSVMPTQKESTFKFI